MILERPLFVGVPCLPSGVHFVAFYMLAVLPSVQAERLHQDQGQETLQPCQSATGNPGWANSIETTRGIPIKIETGY